MPARRLLIYRTGETAAEVVREVGNYAEWFGRVVGERAVLVKHSAACEPNPSTAGIDGIIVTGSPLSLVEPEAWMDDAAGFVRDAAAAGVPVLGVCFGHQLVGHAFGGTVRRNPRGWEAGTHEVALTEAGRADALFAGLDRALRVNQSHRDEVATLGADTVVLADGEHSAHQAIAIGDHVRGVQFHPEMNAAVIRRVITCRRLILDDDAHATGRTSHHDADTLLARAADTPDAERIVLNFIAHFVQRA